MIKYEYLVGHSDDLGLYRTLEKLSRLGWRLNYIEPNFKREYKKHYKLIFERERIEGRDRDPFEISFMEKEGYF